MAGESLLKGFPKKRFRDPRQDLQYSMIQRGCRELRSDFLAIHAVTLYERLTDDLTVHKDLSELAFGAAELCPGLAPTPAQMESERNELQSDKEGLEVDQGLLFHSLLGSALISRHIIQACLRPTQRALKLLTEFRQSQTVDLGTVVIDRRGSAAHITINNQSCLNAEDNRLVEDLETAVDLALLDDEVCVGVLRGGYMSHPRYAGKRVFSAGLNLKELRAGRISFIEFFLRRELGFINKIYRGLHTNIEPINGHKCNNVANVMGKPWIAAVDSFAIGGGAQLLFVFDRVLAASDSYFSLPAAQEGIIPGFANLRISRSFGGRKCRQMLLGGQKLQASDPDASLVYDEVMATELIDDAIKRNVSALSKPAVKTNRHMLNLAEEPLDIFLQYAAEFALLQSQRIYGLDVLQKIHKFER